jgi:hypothetical protein
MWRRKGSKRNQNSACAPQVRENKSIHVAPENFFDDKIHRHTVRSYSINAFLNGFDIAADLAKVQGEYALETRLS